MDLLYGELAKGRSVRGRPRFTTSTYSLQGCLQRDLISVDIDVERSEDLAIDRNKWRQEVREGHAISEAKQRKAAGDIHTRRETISRQPLRTHPTSAVCIKGLPFPHWSVQTH